MFDDGHSYCFSCQYYCPPEGAATVSRDTDVFTYEFVPWRGIHQSTFALYDIKSKVDLVGKPISIGFRYPNGDIKVRLIDKKEFYWVNNSEHSKGLFGEDKFGAGTHKYVTVTEGELDACSIYQACRCGPVVSVRSSSSAVSDCLGSRDYLSRFERIYLAFDNDAQGRAATAAVARLFDAAKVFDLKFTSRKDANEYLQADEAEELRNIWWNATTYLPDNLIAVSESVAKELLEGVTEEGVPYPISSLTGATYGIRKGEVVLVTAQEKVGKTEFLHAIEHSILKRTSDNVGGFYLEENAKRHLQALAGLELKRPIHLPDHRCSTTETLAALKQVVGKDGRLFIYSLYGHEDPDVIIDTCRYLATGCAVRYMFIDPLSMVCSGHFGEMDERRAIDYLVTKLAMQARELGYALIVSSHLNDEGKTRGSRWLTKTFDITINLDRNLNDPDPYTRSLIGVTVPFNRFCGKTGPVCTVRYDPLTCTYTEVEGEQLRTPDEKSVLPYPTFKGKRAEENLEVVRPIYANDNSPTWEQAQSALVA